MEFSLNASPQIFDLALSTTEPQTLSPWPFVLMKSIKAEFPLPQPSTMCTLPQKIVLFLPSKLLLFPVAVPFALRSLVLAIAVLQPLLPPHAILICLNSIMSYVRFLFTHSGVILPSQELLNCSLVKHLRTALC